MSRLATRREFFGAGAFGGLLMAHALAAANANRLKPAVLIYMPGGPSHIDTFDPKPSAPVEIRGEFATIQTTTPGVRFSEHLPLLARMFDKLAVIRAVTGMQELHSDVAVMTGYPAQVTRDTVHPSIGSVVSRLRGATAAVPPFISLRGMSPGCEPGFLGIAHRAFSPGARVQSDLSLPAGITPKRFAARRQLLERLQTCHHDAETSTATTGLEAFQQQGLELIASGRIREALDVSRELPAVQEQYDGAEQFLKARRLVEAGVGCITLSVGEWDTHRYNFRRHKDNLPALDRGASALVGDLHDRGMGKDVVVVAWGEFGRTPRVNKDGGRDHWTPVMSALLAGGGFNTGRCIGATTPTGDQASEGACSVQQVLAGIYTAVGIDPGTTFLDQSGRPRHLLDDRAPIPGLV